MYETCVAADFSITVLSVILIILLIAVATLWAACDRAGRNAKPWRDRCRKLQEDNQVLRQQKGVLVAELRQAELAASLRQAGDR